MAQRRVTNKRVLESITQVNDSLRELKRVVGSSHVDKIIMENELLPTLPFGKTTLWNEVKEGRFPAPRRATPHRKGWLASEIDDWVKSRPVVEQYADESSQAAA